MMTQTHLHCPNCNQMDRVQKVSAIVSAGTASGVYTGFGNGVGYTSNGPVLVNDYIALSGNSQTSLGRLLSPPPQPTYNRSLGFWPFNALVILWIVLVITSLVVIIDFQSIINGDQLIINYGMAALICIALIALIRSRHKNESIMDMLGPHLKFLIGEEQWITGTPSTTAIVVMVYSFQVSHFLCHLPG